MKFKITEKSYESYTLFLLALAIIYVIISLLPTEQIKRFVTYGPEIDIYIFVSAATYIVKYSLEQLSKILSYKSGMVARILEIIFGTFLIFAIDFIPFIIDFKHNQFVVLNWLQMILFTLLFVLTFIINPIRKIYYMRMYKKIDLIRDLGYKIIENEKRMELRKLDLE